MGAVRGNTPGTAERLVGRTVLFPESWAPFESVGYRKPPSLRFSNVQAVCLLNGGSRFEKKRTRWPKPSGCHRRRLRPNHLAIAIPGIAKERAAPLANPSHHGDGWPESDRLRLRAWTAKNDCRRCRDVVRYGSIGWAAVVQRRTDGWLTEPTNHPLQPSGDHPFFHGTSIRRRRLNGGRSASGRGVVPCRRVG
jgi:hypothetical protein